MPGLSRAASRVAVISDMNGSYGGECCEPGVAEAVRRLVERGPDLVIVTGDMVAGQRLDPPLSREAVEAMWESFHAKVTVPIVEAGIPLAVTPGNHDASAYERFALERGIYREQWTERVPSLRFVDRENYPFDYAFSLGEALFVSLDVTRPGPVEKGRLDWLDRLLAREGGKFRHRAVFSHLPIFPFSQGRETEVTADRELERLLTKRGVDLYLSGHHHAYYPGFFNGVRHVGQACMGAGPRKLIGSERVSKRAVTWIEFDGDRVDVTALTFPLLDRAIDIETLPRRIRSRHGTLIRDDLRSEAPGGQEASEPDIYREWKGTTP
jgi:hypothetical protein